MLPAVVCDTADRRVAVAHGVAQQMGLHAVDDRMSQRKVAVDIQRKPLVAERIVDTSRRVRHDIAQIELVLLVDNLFAVLARGTFAVAPFVVTGIFAALDYASVAYTVTVRLFVIECCVGFSLRLDDMVDLIAVYASQRFADGSTAEAVTALGRFVSADTVCTSARRTAVRVDLVVAVLLGQRQHLVAGKRIGDVGRPAEMFLADIHRTEFDFHAVEPGAAHVRLD